MEITQTTAHTALQKTDLDRMHLEQRQAILNQHRPTVNERPTTFERRPVPDLAPASNAVLRVRASIEEAKYELDQHHSMIQRLSAKEDRYAELTQARAETLSNLHEDQAQALLSETSTSSEHLRSRLQEIESELLNAPDSIEAIQRAKSMVTKQLQSVTERLEDLTKKAAAAERAWLEVYHENLMEDVRASLHDLHRVLAKSLAVEQVGNFERYQRLTWQLVQWVSEGVPFAASTRPDWANCVKPSAFPGCAQATEEVLHKLASLSEDDQ